MVAGSDYDVHLATHEVADSNEIPSQPVHYQPEDLSTKFRLHEGNSLVFYYVLAIHDVNCVLCIAYQSEVHLLLLLCCFFVEGSHLLEHVVTDWFWCVGKGAFESEEERTVYYSAWIDGEVGLMLDGRVVHKLPVSLIIYISKVQVFAALMLLVGLLHFLQQSL